MRRCGCCCGALWSIRVSRGSTKCRLKIWCWSWLDSRARLFAFHCWITSPLCPTAANKQRRGDSAVLMLFFCRAIKKIFRIIRVNCIFPPIVAISTSPRLWCKKIWIMQLLFSAERDLNYQIERRRNLVSPDNGSAEFHYDELRQQQLNKHCKNDGMEKKHWASSQYHN